MTMPKTGPISFGDINTQLRGRAATAQCSLGELEVREAVRNKDNPIGLADFRGVAVGMVKDNQNTSSWTLGRIHRTQYGGVSDFTEERKPVDSNNIDKNEDPWGDKVWCYFKPDTRRCAVNLDLLWKDGRAGVTFVVEATRLDGAGTQIPSESGAYIVVVATQNNWGVGTQDVLLNELVDKGTPGSGLIKHAFEFTTETSKPFLTLSLQNQCEVGASSSTRYGLGWNYVQVREK